MAGGIRVFISVLSEESLLLFLYLIFLKHETKTGKSLTEYNHSKREWEGGKQGGACLQGLLQLWSLPLRAFTRMILIRLTGVGANCLGIRTQKRRAPRKAEESQKQHNCLSYMMM